jgi:hypothetical protein
MQAVNDPTTPTRQWIYGWCEQLSEIPGAPCQGEVFAQSDDYTGDPALCVSYSGGAYADFYGEAIPLQNVTFTDQVTVMELEGVHLIYANGAACEFTGLPMTFNINIFCEPNTEGDYNPVANLFDPCNPTVQLISKYGCPAMSVNQIMEYLAKFEAYFGIFFIAGGVILCFFGY